jgi:hypothetical protein
MLACRGADHRCIRPRPAPPLEVLALSPVGQRGSVRNMKPIRAVHLIRSGGRARGVSASALGVDRVGTHKTERLAATFAGSRRPAGPSPRRGSTASRRTPRRSAGRPSAGPTQTSSCAGGRYARRAANNILFDPSGSRSDRAAGEIELESDNVRGSLVHVGARVAALAGPSQVLVSSTVSDLVAGSGLVFADAGEHE